MNSTSFLPGTKYNGFRIDKAVNLSELKAHLVELTHEKTGASVLAILNDDPENVFCLSFQTLPDSSNGAAHILEHTVLCGSAKYPIKDPFFAMGRRSLNTFMNALTGSDFTCYPAASQVKKDFYNLLEVYLDAVFHPELKEQSFKQEGHRLEFEQLEEGQKKLVRRGVVYNEMKGAMNSGSARMHEALTQALFPDVTYGVNSGGDPFHIPDLTYQELLDFHKKYYHPSRCLFYFYGNIPLAEHLDFISSHVLETSSKTSPLPPIPLQPRFREMKRIDDSYPVAPDEETKNKTLISFGCLTCKGEDQETCLALDILEMVLLDTDASPLKKALLRSGLCKQVSSYLDTEIHEVPFVLNLKGCEAADADALEKVLFNSLRTIAKEGIPLNAIENAIHQEEFHRSEISGDHYPFGLSLFMRSALAKQHGGDPEKGLLIHELFDALRDKIAKEPDYFSSLIHRFFLDNPHWVRIVLKPNPNLEREEAEREQASLDALERGMSDEEKQRIENEALSLKAFQDLQEKANIDLLPKVTLEDAAKSVRSFPLKQEKLGNLNIFHHDCFTNEICYADLMFDLPPLSFEELPYVRLLTVLLHQMGTEKTPYEPFLDSLQAHTGGIAAYLTLQVQAENENAFRPALGIRGKSLYRKMDKLFPLLNEIATCPAFSDEERLREVVHKHLSNLESGFNQNALRYATSLASSALSHPNQISESWYGLRYLQTLREIEKQNDYQALGVKLKEMADKILCRGTPDLILGMDKIAFENIKKERFFGLADIPVKPKTPWNYSHPLSKIDDQAVLISSPVAFLSHVFKTVPYVHPEGAALRASSHLLENVVLHKKIREEGGAYGGGAVSNGASGNFYFYSYRDPHIASTLKAFEESIHAIASGKFTAEDLEEAKFEMIQDLDAPIPPGSRAEVAYSWMQSGKTEVVRQTFRDKLLKLTPKEVAKAVAELIVPKYPFGSTVVFAGKGLIEKENKKLKKPFQIS